MLRNVVIYLQQVRGVQLRSEVYQVSPYLVTKVSEPHPKLCKPSTDSIIFCLRSSKCHNHSLTITQLAHHQQHSISDCPHIGGPQTVYSYYITFYSHTVEGRVYLPCLLFYILLQYYSYNRYITDLLEIYYHIFYPINFKEKNEYSQSWTQRPLMGFKYPMGLYKILSTQVQCFSVSFHQPKKKLFQPGTPLPPVQ